MANTHGLKGNHLTSAQQSMNYALLALVLIVMALPMWNVFVLSTSTALSASAAGLKLWWRQFSLEGYEFVFTVTKLGRAFFNSMFVSLVSTTIQVVLSALAGYILIQTGLPLRNLIASFIMVTMMIPGDLTLISIYQLNKSLNILDSYQGLIINGLVSGFSILLMRSYFLSTPYSLAECSRLDGAGELRIFFQIYLPLSLPGVATIFFLEFVNKWNAISIPASIITSQRLYTLPLLLKSMVIEVATTSGAPRAPANAIMAAIVISTVPLLFIYVIAQRFLMSGITLGATKE